MADESFSLSQNIFKRSHPAIPVVCTPLLNLKKQTVLHFLDTTTPDGHLGMAAAYGSKNILDYLAFSTPTHVLLVRLPRKKQSIPAGTKILLQNLILHSSRQKTAFRMDGVAAALHFDLSLRITSGVDLLSAFPATPRWSLEGLMQALGGEAHLQKQNVLSLLERDKKVKTQAQYTALEAWLACRALDTADLAPLFAGVPRIDTKSLPETVR